jgi:hypothetical protein
MRRRFLVLGFLLSAFSSVDAQTTFISTNASWKYLDNGSNQGTSWRSPSFYDGAWKTGTAQLGYGDGDETTVVSFGPNVSNKYITTYFRKTVNISNPSQYVFNLSLLKDDGAVVYINGVEVVRSNMPSGSVYNTTLALSSLGSPDESTFKNYTIPSSRFVNGNNLVAVEVHQSSGGSSDMSFNLKLTGTAAAAICSSTGFIFREVWINIPGDHVSDIPLNTQPVVKESIQRFETERNIGDNYGHRLSGYLCPPYTGNYTFWISSDDDAELWLSTDANPANKRRIAYVNGWTNYREWTKYPSQKSVSIQLTAGTKYYVESLHKEATGEDHHSVGWQLPNGTLERPIMGNRLSPTSTSPTPTDKDFILANSSWQYLDNGSDQGTAWRQTVINDNNLWKIGNAELGYGDGGEATVVSYGASASNKYITTYFRRDFEINDATAFGSLELSLIRDDGAVVYLNGTEIYRSNMPSGIIYYNTLAPSYIDGTNETTWIVANTSKAALRNGQNVVAVEIHQNSPSSSDISFNLKLRGLVSGSRLAGTETSTENLSQNVDHTKSDFLLYPNPTTGKFTIEFCRDNVKDENLSVQIVNSLGQIVYRKEPQRINGCIHEIIELENSLSSGIYIMNVITGEGTESKKIFLTN